MSAVIKKLEPALLWKQFYNLTQIPRPSKFEAKAVDYIRSFGQTQGLDTQVDSLGNVIIRKPATPGYENRKGVILQSHIDMVPQANAHFKFNFETDPIDAWIDKDWVKARNTTLGADNGIGVAASLAILQSRDISHGPLEALITIDEESGMSGAWAVKPEDLKGHILINLDSEDENDLSVGCAGGVNVGFEWQYNETEIPRKNETYKISITGLKGGHSGMDIHLGRGNACKLMGYFLKRAISRSNARLVSLECGNMRNAIPREAFALVTIPTSGIDNLQWLVAEMQSVWMN